MPGKRTTTSPQRTQGQIIEFRVTDLLERHRLEVVGYRGAAEDALFGVMSQLIRAESG